MPSTQTIAKERKRAIVKAVLLDLLSWWEKPEAFWNGVNAWTLAKIQKEIASVGAGAAGHAKRFVKSGKTNPQPLADAAEEEEGTET